MARIRSIKPELLEDEKTASLPHDTWRLFVSVLLLADDYGNLRASPKLIDGAVFWAHDDADVGRMLRELGEAGLLRFYTVKGQRYASVNGWTKHQKVDHPGKPLCPGPEQADQEPPAQPAPEIGGTRATDARDPREDFGEASRLTGTGIRTKDQDPEGDPRPPARDPAAPATAQEPPARPMAIAKPKAPTAYELKFRFGVIRSEVSDGVFMGWEGISDPRGETAAWIASLSDEAIPDLEPAMRLALANMRDSVREWDDPKLWRDANYGFSAFRARFSSLRESMHGRSAVQRKAGARASPALPDARIALDQQATCNFHREIPDKASAEFVPWCVKCKRFGARKPRTTASEDTDPAPLSAGAK